VLVQEGKFPHGWDTRLLEVLNDLGGADLGRVTLRELATHRAGVVHDLEPAVEESLASEVRRLTPVEARARFVRLLAQQPLVHKPGERFGPYSNAGYVVLSAAAEVAAGEAWEDLVRSRVAAPLSMHSLDFGIPPLVVGHDEDGVPRPNAEDPPWHHGSFSVHSTLSDWATFVRAHAASLSGKGKGLTQALGLDCAAVRVLHTPVSPAVEGEAFDGPEGPEAYAMGWKCEWEEEDDSSSAPSARPLKPTGILWHWGTNFLFNSGSYVNAEKELLILIASNSGSSLARLASRLAFESVIRATSENA